MFLSNVYLAQFVANEPHFVYLYCMNIQIVAAAHARVQTFASGPLIWFGSRSHAQTKAYILRYRHICIIRAKLFHMNLKRIKLTQISAVFLYFLINSICLQCFQSIRTNDSTMCSLWLCITTETFQHSHSQNHQL